MCRTMNELEKVVADYRSLKTMKEQLEEEMKAAETTEDRKKDCKVSNRKKMETIVKNYSGSV